MKAMMMRVKNVALALWCQVSRKGALRNIFVTGNAFGCLSKYSHISRKSMKPKIAYSSKQSALKAADKMGAKHGVHFSVYKCAWCDGWHIGKNAQNKYEDKSLTKSADLHDVNSSIKPAEDRVEPKKRSKPVEVRPWGGPYYTWLMLELCPDEFPEGKVAVTVDAGYLGTSKDEDPQVWVKTFCSGLVLDSTVYEEDNQMLIFRMHFDEKAVKADSPYPYLVSGPGDGEYTVRISNKVWTVFKEDFCCK